MAIAKAALVVGGRRHSRPNMAKQRARHARRGRLFRVALTTLLVVMWASDSTTKATAAAAAPVNAKMDNNIQFQCVYSDTAPDVDMEANVSVDPVVNMDANVNNSSDVDMDSEGSVNSEANIDTAPVPTSAPRAPPAPAAGPAGSAGPAGPAAPVAPPEAHAGPAAPPAGQAAAPAGAAGPLALDDPEDPEDGEQPDDPGIKTSTICRGLRSVVIHAHRQPGVPFDVDELLDLINVQVDQLSRAAVLATLLVDLAVVRHQTNIDANPNADLQPFVVVQATYHGAISLVSNTGRNPNTKARQQPFLRQVYFEDFLPSLPPPFMLPVLHKVGYSVNYLASEMVTNYNNYLNITVPQHIKTYLKHASGASWREFAPKWNQAKEDLEHNNVANQEDYNNQHYLISREFLILLRDLGPERLNYIMLQETEEFNRSPAHINNPDDVYDRPVYACAPIRRCQRQFITIDNRWLTMNNIRRTIDNFHPRRNHHQAGNIIKTDGVGVSLPYTRPRHGLELGLPPEVLEQDGDGNMRTTPDILLYDHTDGLFSLRRLHPGSNIDPEAPEQERPWEAFDTGRKTLLHGHLGTKVTSGDWAQWRGFRRAQRELQRAKANADVQWAEQLRAVFTYKTSDPEQLKVAITTTLDPAAWNAIWRLYGARSHARRRFKAKIRELRSWDRLANVVLGPHRDRIAVLGNGMFRSSAHGRAAVPTRSIWRKLADRGLVVLVDEFKTTVTCCHCHHRNRFCETAWSTLHCSNKRCRVTWNRDANAAINIAVLWLYYHAGYDRPVAFRRPGQHHIH